MENPKIFARDLISRKNVGVTASVIQRSDLLLHTFVTDAPAIIFLRRGRKTVTIGSKKIVIRPQEAIAIAAGTTCEVLNETDGGQFESTWIVCDEFLIKSFSQEHSGLKKLNGCLALKKIGPEFSHSFELAVNAIRDTPRLPECVAQSRVRELLVWLASVGSAFACDRKADLPQKVRMMVASDLMRPWTSPEMASLFAMSEASFRRRLSESKLTFNQILIDVRMTSALTLLQVTDAAISEIAYKVGYESASRFAVRFKARFGFLPSAVRGRIE